MGDVLSSSHRDPFSSNGSNRLAIPPTSAAEDIRNPLASSDGPALDVETDSTCEWVKPSTRADGIEVQGYWRSKPGKNCSLVEPERLSGETARPHRPRNTSKQIYVGPRGGRYHYSKSGKKVYEHK
jgi:hypothetical protein